MPRQIVRQIESRGNVTLGMFQQIAAQLPHLRTLSLPAVELQTRGARASEVRDAFARRYASSAP